MEKMYFMRATMLLLIVIEGMETLTLALNQTTSRATAIFVFGDSIVDPGNNNALSTVVKCNFPPYGQDFPGHVATGRFSNGRIPTDFLASYMRIKEFVPAYLGTELDDSDFITGVSFASGACGYDPLTGKLTSVLTMDDQLSLFKEYKEKLKVIVGEEKSASIISNSLYIVITGTDDLANTYFTTPARRDFDLPSYITFLVQSASSFFQKLYNLGARKISVAGVPPIGCIPMERTLAGGIDRECSPLYNQAAMALNLELSAELQRLNNTLQGSRVVYIDMYTPLLDLILHPSTYGFEESSKGCCGTGTFEVTLTCNSYTTSICEDVSKYVFWDSYHPTERAYGIVIKQIIQRYNAYIN